MGWDVIVSSEQDPLRSTYDMHVLVKVPLAFVADLSRENVQHEIVEYVRRRLHEFVDAEFARSKLNEERIPLCLKP